MLPLKIRLTSQFKQKKKVEKQLNILKFLKKEKTWLSIYFTNERQIQTFLDNQELRQFVTSLPAPKHIVKVMHSEKQNDSRIKQKDVGRYKEQTNILGKFKQMLPIKSWIHISI